MLTWRLQVKQVYMNKGVSYYPSFDGGFFLEHVIQVLEDIPFWNNMDCYGRRTSVGLGHPPWHPLMATCKVLTQGPEFI